MASYKLTYFDTRGRAELTRLIFAAGDVAYVDNRVKGEEWKKMKSSTPLGQLPVLEVGGKTYPQSIAIARYAARITGLLGKNELEQFQSDVILGTVGDLIQGLVKAFFEEDEAKKAEGKKQLTEETMPKILSALEKMMDSYGGKSGFFVGSDLTWADLAVYNVLEIPLHHNADLLSKYSKLSAHRRKISAIPKIKAWLDKRPPSDW